MPEFSGRYKRYKGFFIFSQLILTFLFFSVSGTFAHSPHDIIYALEISPTYDQDKTLFIIVHGGRLLKSTDGGFSWKRLVNGLDSEHFLSSIVISPSYHLDKTLFLSSGGDGIYRSIDGGSSWDKVNNGLTNLSIRLLAISPGYHSDKIVLAAGTEGGLYKTKNGGESWHQVIDDDIKITAIAFSPELKKEYILIGDDKGALYVSTDGGDVWQQRSRIPDGGAITSTAISPHFSSDGTFFAGTERRGIFKTVDGGTSFVEVNNGVSDQSILSAVMSPDYGNGTDSAIFVSTWYDGVFGSSDGGKTWKKYSRGLTSSPQADEVRFKSPHFRDLRISRTFGKDRTIFLGGYDGLFKSTDGGHIWIEMETLLAKHIQGLALSPGYEDDSTVAIATFDGGVYITKDEGITWEVVNRGLYSTHLMDITFSPNFPSDNTIFTISNDSFYKLNSKGRNWDSIKFGYQGWRRFISSVLRRMGLPSLLLLSESEKQPVFPVVIAVSPEFVSDNTVYFGTRYQGIFRSVDGGLNWSPIWKGKLWRQIETLALSRWITSLVISPDFVSDKTLYAGIRGGGIYKTVDGGNTWQSMYNRHQEWVFLAISPHYKIDKTVFASTTEGLVKTVDGGESWEKLGDSGYDENDYIEAIAISPNYKNDQTVIISVKGRGLFKSDNGGLSFVEIGTDLVDNNHSLTLIEFSPAYSIDNTIYGASEEELFQSTDGGNTWKFIKRPIRYENTKDYIYYDGLWKVSKDNDFSAMSVSHSYFAGSKATFNFVGTGVNWIGTKSNNQGISKVYIDGDFKGYVDQFNDTREVMVRSYSITDLPYGPHSIMIEVTNTKNPKSRGWDYRIEIDAFDVIP